MKLNYTTKTWIPVTTGCCQEVVLCLTDEAASKVEAGTSYVVGTIQNTGRKLGMHDGCLPFENPRCVDMFQYQIDVSDDLLSSDLTCADIVSVFTDPCVFEKLTELIADLEARLAVVETTLEG